MKERDALIEELVLSNQTQLERNETLTVQNEDLRGECNEVVSAPSLACVIPMLYRHQIFDACCAVLASTWAF